jgi:malonyl-CoA/methylmalonyl-CoA synthetase
LMGVPTFYTRLLDQPGLDRESTAHMRLFVSGSAPLSSETHTAWSARTGHAILERYGMTETNMNSSNPYEGPRKPGAVGLPLEGVEIRIVDPESGKALPRGEVGGIEVRGPNVFKGYWKNPGKTASEFRPDGFFMTGDVGKFDEDGYLAIVGRAKDLIITGGFNVYPAEVESEIASIDGVAECAVVGLPDRDFGESVNAVVVRAKGSRLKSADVAAALGTQLARYKQPKRVFFVRELPRNAMGKIQKNVLREKLGPGGDPAALGVEDA